tara:strand:- start:670 stop:891 length:222 start_codon:yes stop_codon:yes gene_type:complete
VTPEIDRGIASLKHPNKKETSMTSVVKVLVSMFGPRNSAQNDILTYAKTEYKNDWKHKYNELMDRYNRTGAWK